MSNAKPGQSFAPVPNYQTELISTKLKRKTKSFIVRKIANTPLQFALYRSYWHYILSADKTENYSEIKSTHFLAQVPNYGAGIGHQLANWNSGWYFANFFKVRFAHVCFSNSKWENFFDFGHGEAQAPDILKNKKFRVVQLPRFDSLNHEEVSLVGRIIDSYKKHHVLFFLELDQGYVRQWDTYRTLSDKFFKAKAREKDMLIYSPDKFNIAIHIRRRMKIEPDEVWRKRGLDNSYYANILTRVLSALNYSRNVEVYLFSQGNKNDFPEFEKFDNIRYCHEMGPVATVLHLVNADLLIGSKSSFSYKPALISRAIQICPKTFWHEYPPDPNYILADDSGEFNIDQLLTQLHSSNKLRLSYNSLE
jgi:hypothetical protein